MSNLQFYVLLGAAGLALVLFSIRQTSSQAKIGRVQFLIQSLGLGLFGGLPIVLAGYLENPGIGLTLVVVAFGFIAFLAARWSAERLQDIGWSKWLALLAFLPYANWVFFALLVFWPGMSAKEEKGQRATDSPSSG